MADLIDIILNRRSIRKYEDREIPEKVLNQLLEALRWSPSWANTQCWEVVVVKSAAVKARLKETIYPKNPSTAAIEAAPMVLALCGKLKSAGYYKGVAPTKLGDWYMFDLGIATQTICLTAQHLGLGTVVVGMFDHDRASEVLKVPGDSQLVALIPLGYPAQSAKAPKRKEIGEFVHFDGF